MPDEGRDEGEKDSVSSRNGLVESGLCGRKPGLTSELGVDGEAALLRKGLLEPSVMLGEACLSVPSQYMYF